MTLLANFHFIRPSWLLLLPVVVGIWWLVRQSEDPLRGWRKLIDRKLLQALVVRDGGHGRWTGIGRLVAWSLCVMAIAGPTWRPEPSPFADDPVPVIVVLKANETMDLNDLVPSRMERARLKVADFAAERTAQPMGLVAYAGTAHLVLPPTRDTSVVASMAAEISPSIMPRTGDDLPAALKLAAGTMNETGGSIVVVADTIGKENVTALSEFAATSSCPVHILAIARDDTPEWDAIRESAKALRADATLITPDMQDVRGLVRSTAQAPVAVTAAGAGTRWSEAGWWLVPLLAFFSLLPFRRTRPLSYAEATS